MLQKCKTAEEAANISSEAQKMFAKMENSKKPIVAAINGVCLGGGLELALACHYRVATKDKKTGLALPEVMLGLLPGAGGTQRLPKLTSIPTALDMALTGRTIKADRAKKLGLVDLLVTPLGPGLDTSENLTISYLETVAVGIAKDLASGKIKVNREKTGLVNQITQFAFGINWVKDQVFSRAKAQVMKLSGGLYPAPLKILEVIREGLDKGSEAGYAAETRVFGELSQTPESKGLISLFFGQTECKKNRFGKPSKPINTVSIL